MTQPVIDPPPDADIWQVLSRCQDETALGEALVAQAAAVSGAQRVLLLTDTGEEWRVANAHPSDVEQPDELMRRIAPLLAELRRSGRIPWPNAQPAADEPHRPACLMAPLAAHHAWLGLLHADRPGPPGEFTANQQQLLSGLAALAAMALSHMRLRAELGQELEERKAVARDVLAAVRQRTAELAVIGAVQRLLAGDRSMQDIYDVIGDKLREVFPSMGVQIRTLDESAELVEFPYLYVHFDRSRRRIQGLPTGTSGFFQHVRKTGQTLLVNEDWPGAMVRLGSQLLTSIDRQAKSELLVPLTIAGKFAGVLVLTTIEREHAFSDHDVRLLETLAASMATALHNARLFDETRHLLNETQTRHAELAAVNRVQQGIAAQLDQHGVIDLVGRQLLEASKAARATVWIDLLDDDPEPRRFVFAAEPASLCNEAAARLWRDAPAWQSALRTRTTLCFTTAADALEAGLAIGDSGEVPGLSLCLATIPGALGTGLGTVALMTRRDHAFPASLVRVLETVVASMGVAFDNLRLLREARDARSQAESARQQADAANAAKSTFLATVSHEIRTPMNGVIGMTGLLLSSPLNAVQREHAETIRDSAETLLVAINDVLDFSKIEAGRVDIESQPFDPRECVRLGLDLVSVRAAHKGLRLSAEVDVDVPAVVQGDATHVRQVLLNLLSNAVKFTDQGAVALHVSAPQPGRLRFNVCDTGIGMSEQDRSRLFQRFSQADSSIARRYGGTGLGLAISRQLAELMDGSLRAHSDGRGLGSSFCFELPAPAVAGQLLPQRIGLPIAADLQMAARHPLRILLAEDNGVNRMLALRLLEQWGYRADVAGNGQEAIQSVARQIYDVVLMDVRMPEMDGLQATREIRGRWPEARRPRIIAMTANALRGDRPQCLAAGMDDYLTKPLRPDELVRALMDSPRLHAC